MSRGRRAVSFIEICIGALVFAVLSLPIYVLMTSTRTDTASAVNYLRALELAQETVEWVTMIPVNSDFDRTVEGLSGSLVKEEGRSFVPIDLPVGLNPQFSSALLTKARFPDGYVPAFFHRGVRVEDYKGVGDHRDGLKKVTVTIRWNEGKTPAVLEPTLNQAEGSRMKKVSLAILVCDKNTLY
jgi:hypothetical protein